MGKLLNRALGRTRYSKMPSASAKLQCSKLVIFVPHEAEYPAVGPLIDKIKAAKSDLDIVVKVSDTRERILEIRRKIGDYGKKISDRKICELLFSIRDLQYRLETIANLTYADPNIGILELHSLPRNYGENEHFPYHDYYFRLHGSRLLIPRSLDAEYPFAIHSMLQIFNSLSVDPDTVKSFSNRLGDFLFIKLDLNSLSILIDSSRFVLLEVPADSRSIVIPDGTPFHTSFEIIRAGRESEPAILIEKDIRAVLSIFD